ncbi:MAG: hypothetical protein ABIE03_06455 [Patescibacteria group bacterium]|nr:hypothetical protein [Patescibacteria group bacterium]
MSTERAGGARYAKPPHPGGAGRISVEGQDGDLWEFLSTEPRRPAESLAEEQLLLDNLGPTAIKVITTLYDRAVCSRGGVRGLPIQLQDAWRTLLRLCVPEAEGLDTFMRDVICGTPGSGKSTLIASAQWVFSVPEGEDSFVFWSSRARFTFMPRTNKNEALLGNIDYLEKILSAQLLRELIDTKLFVFTRKHWGVGNEIRIACDGGVPMAVLGYLYNTFRFRYEAGDHSQIFLPQAALGLLQNTAISSRTVGIILHPELIQALLMRSNDLDRRQMYLNGPGLGLLATLYQKLAEAGLMYGVSSIMEMLKEEDIPSRMKTFQKGMKGELGWDRDIAGKVLPLHEFVAEVERMGILKDARNRAVFYLLGLPQEILIASLRVYPQAVSLFREVLADYKDLITRSIKVEEGSPRWRFPHKNLYVRPREDRNQVECRMDEDFFLPLLINIEQAFYEAFEISHQSFPLLLGRSDVHYVWRSMARLRHILMMACHEESYDAGLFLMGINASLKAIDLATRGS